MRLALILILFSSLYSNSQIWKEPFDTTSYGDRLTRMSENNLDVLSYSVSQFDSSDNVFTFDYYEFDERGLLIKMCFGRSPEQKVDTVQYFYDIYGVFQESVGQGKSKVNVVRKFIKDSLNRTIAITKQVKDSISTTQFYYSSSGNLDSIKYETERVRIFHYDNNNNLIKKLIVDNGKVSEEFNYSYPKGNMIAYTQCNSFKVYNETVTACDSTIGTFNKHGDLLKIESHYYKDENSPHFTKFKYDRKRRILKMSSQSKSDNASTIYYRNRKGLLTKVEHKDEHGRVYGYSVFKYQYR
jgi:hypothetical protein